MNILTFDIEEWYIEKIFHSLSQQKYNEFNEILNVILDTLDETGTKATFFCLGKIAEQFPNIIYMISSRGHEIGCHSNVHTWINKMSPKSFWEDTKIAVSQIENLIGKKVLSYRAPAFSICEADKWAFEILAENGIENDASIFPGSRDFGGFPSFTSQKPVIIQYNGIEINEFPIPLASLPIIKKQFAFSGGGYFRILPYNLIHKLMTKNTYNMCYFHIADLLMEKSPLMTKTQYENYFKQPGTFKARFSRYFKANIGRSTALNNLKRLISEFNFISIEEYNKQFKISKIISL